MFEKLKSGLNFINVKLSGVSTEYLSGTGVFSTPAGGAGDFTVSVTKTVDDTVTNSTTLTDDSELFFSTVAAESVWLIEGLLVYSSNDANADFKFDFSVGGATAYGSFRVDGISSGDVALSTATMTVFNQANPSAAQAVAGDAGGSVRGVNFRGIMKFSSNTNFRIRFAQNTLTAAKDAKLKAGSILRAKRLV